MNLLFKRGQKVRHQLGKRIMIVGEYETKIRPTILKLGERGYGGPLPVYHTGKVRCSWVDESNNRKEDIFDQSELELIEDHMIPDSFTPDRVSVKSKSTGIISDQVKASVEPNKISIMPADGISVEPGDTIYRHLSNGRVEMYDVIDSTFNEAWKGFKSSYTVKVRKSGVIDQDEVRYGHIFNVHMTGDNARFNNASNDYSTNTVQINKVDDQIAELRNEIEKLQLSKMERDEALELIQELYNQVHSQKPKLSLVKTILTQLSEHGANVASIASVILQLVLPAH